MNTEELKDINFRTLARLISNAGFRKLTLTSNYKAYGKLLKNTIERGGYSINNDCSIKDLMDLSYLCLQSDYRHEYVYKTNLISQYILNNYSLGDSIILNEFKINKSIADLTLINGVNKVFEIKSELDSPFRLKTQINDYYKAFSEVYIVTYFSLAEKYKQTIDDKVGIIQLNSNFTFSTIREAAKNCNQLDNNAMMRSLRKKEFMQIIINLFGELPNTTQVNLYKECLKQLENKDPQEIQRNFLNILKERKTANQLLVKTANIPEYLKFFCYLENFSEKQYLSLPSRLSCMV